MFRMLSFFLFLLSGLCLYFWWQKEALLAEFLSNQLGQNVEIEKVLLRPDRMIIHHLTLDNPYKSQKKNALEIEQIQCHFSPFCLIQKKKIISKLILTHPHFNLELYNHSGIKNNWAMIFKERLPCSNTNFCIDRLIVRRATCDITRKKNRSSHHALPDFTLTLHKNFQPIGDLFFSLSYIMLSPLTEHLPYQEILQGFSYPTSNLIQLNETHTNFRSNLLLQLSPF